MNDIKQLILARTDAYADRIRRHRLWRVRMKNNPHRYQMVMDLDEHDNLTFKLVDKIEKNLWGHLKPWSLREGLEK